MTDDDLQAIRARVEAATPGPWKFDRDENSEDEGRFVNVADVNVCYFGDNEQYYNTCGDAPSEADRAFIAAARTDVPALLAEVERLQAEVEHYREVVRELRGES